MSRWGAGVRSHPFPVAAAVQPRSLATLVSLRTAATVPARVHCLSRTQRGLALNVTEAPDPVCGEEAFTSEIIQSRAIRWLRRAIPRADDALRRYAALTLYAQD